jgi:hypothetical protein
LAAPGEKDVVTRPGFDTMMMIDFFAKQKKTKQKARCTATECELHHPTLIPLLAMGD